VIFGNGRAAGVRVSQLFRWRLALPDREAKFGQGDLGAGILSDTASGAVGRVPSPSKRSDVTIRLGRGRRVCVDSDIGNGALGRILDCVYERNGGTAMPNSCLWPALQLVLITLDARSLGLVAQ